MKRLDDIAIMFTAIVSIFFGCGQSETPRLTQQQIQRDIPIVYYIGNSGELPNPYLSSYGDSVVTFPVIGNDSRVVVELTDGKRVEMWRVEWKPHGYQCWVYLDGFCIPISCGANHLPASGLVDIRIAGLQDGDSLMYWRSEPWSGPPAGCFEYWSEP